MRMEQICYMEFLKLDFVPYFVSICCLFFIAMEYSMRQITQKAMEYLKTKQFLQLHNFFKSSKCHFLYIPMEIKLHTAIFFSFDGVLRWVEFCRAHGVLKI